MGVRVVRERSTATPSHFLPSFFPLSLGISFSGHAGKTVFSLDRSLLPLKVSRVVRACENAAPCFLRGNFLLISRRHARAEARTRWMEVRNTTWPSWKEYIYWKKSFPPSNGQLQPGKRIATQPCERLPAITLAIREWSSLIRENQGSSS